MIFIGLPRRAIITARGPSTSVLVTRATSISSIPTGFVLFALFNNLPI